VTPIIIDGKSSRKPITYHIL